MSEHEKQAGSESQDFKAGENEYSQLSESQAETLAYEVKPLRDEAAEIRKQAEATKGDGGVMNRLRAWSKRGKVEALDANAAFREDGFVASERAEAELAKDPERQHAVHLARSVESRLQDADIDTYKGTAKGLAVERALEDGRRLRLFRGLGDFPYRYELVEPGEQLTKVFTADYRPEVGWGKSQGTVPNSEAAPEWVRQHVSETLKWTPELADEHPLDEEIQKFVDEGDWHAVKASKWSVPEN